MFRTTEVFKNLDVLSPFLRHIAPENVDWEIHVDRLRLIYRKQWGAMYPRRRFYLTVPVRNVIFIYNTWPESCWKDKDCFSILQKMQYYEMKKAGGPDVKYNFLIDGKGTVYEGRGFRVMPLAPTKFFPLDDKSISIGFIGDHREKGPDFLMWAGALKLLAFGINMTVIKQYFDFAVSRL